MTFIADPSRRMNNRKSKVHDRRGLRLGHLDLERKNEMKIVDDLNNDIATEHRAASGDQFSPKENPAISGALKSGLMARTGLKAGVKPFFSPEDAAALRDIVRT